jgi:hypothetical protein
MYSANQEDRRRVDAHRLCQPPAQPVVQRSMPGLRASRAASAVSVPLKTDILLTGQHPHHGEIMAGVIDVG